MPVPGGRDSFWEKGLRLADIYTRLYTHIWHHQGLEGKRRRKMHPNNDWNASAVQNKTPEKTELCLVVPRTSNGIESFCFQAHGVRPTQVRSCKVLQMLT